MHDLYFPIPIALQSKHGDKLPNVPVLHRKNMSHQLSSGNCVPCCCFALRIRYWYLYAIKRKCT